MNDSIKDYDSFLLERLKNGPRELFRLCDLFCGQYFSRCIYRDWTTTTIEIKSVFRAKHLEKEKEREKERKEKNGRVLII